MEEEEEVTASEAAVAGFKIIGYIFLIFLVIAVSITIFGSLTAGLVVPHG